ncbi:cytosine permease [Gluconobacter japonicus]|uniref:purine-cytosine permease family protein n=1 Tax=Gluconobacter japonicus TaxID=376620 RepID=UPI0024AD1AF4|nr:cytosine permease [Gluconobacter japonicus]MDI6652432.1 cytosine permease [Gluconobacter japonicus]
MAGEACFQTENSNLIEKYSTSFVPKSERHGHVRDLFTLWFTTNIAPLPIVTGAALFTRSHLSLFWCATAIIAGHFLGALVLGACSAQGPQMGLAQMVQARGQFGRYGSVIITLIASILYFGFFTSNTVLAGAALHDVMPVLDIRATTIIGALCAVGIGILGYKTIHLLNRCGIWFMILALALAFFLILRQAPPAVWQIGCFNRWGWFLTFSTSLVWNTSYSCYTSDYSRYLPASIGIARPFAMSFLGSAIGASLSFIFGAFVAATKPTIADPLHALSVLSGGLSRPLLLLFMLNIISHNALNVYGASLSIITLIQTFFAKWLPERLARIAISSSLLITGLILSLMFTTTVVPVFLNIVFALLIVLVPWATINIFDFYFFRKGSYDIGSFFKSDGGIYGLVNFPAIIAFIVGVAVQLPFATNAFFSGLFCDIFNSIDIGWLISPPITILIFYLLVSRKT